MSRPCCIVRAMHRLVWLPLLLAAACGTSTDDRPLEAEYLTQAIFAPTCGATQCHSSFVDSKGVALDTLDGVRQAMVDFALVRLDSLKYDPDNAAKADLIVWITETVPFGGVPGTDGKPIGRMPYDAPMPNKDVLLLKEWIENETPGAQCNPADFGGKACRNKEVVECNPDWSFGNRVMLCSGDCVQGTCK